MKANTDSVLGSSVRLGGLPRSKDVEGVEKAPATCFGALLLKVTALILFKDELGQEELRILEHAIPHTPVSEEGRDILEAHSNRTHTPTVAKPGCRGTCVLLLTVLRGRIPREGGGA